MRKDEFLQQLANYLQALPYSEQQSTIDFYSEQIADRIDDGMSEEEAVASLEHPRDIADNLLSLRDEQNLEFYVAEENPTPKTGSIALLIIVLVLTCWIWIPILLFVFSCIVGIYLSLLAIILGALAISLALVIGGVAALVIAAPLFMSSPLAAISHIGLALGLFGLAIFAFLISYFLAKFTVWATKGIVISIAHYFERRRDKKRSQNISYKKVQINNWGER